MPHPRRSDSLRRQPTKRVTASERRDGLDQFLTRLRELGAAADEVQMVAEGWDDLDPDGTPDQDGHPAWTRQRRAEMANLSDTELRSMILASREEYEVGTTTEEEQEARARQARMAAAASEAQARIGGSVASVLAWVADDVDRAEAVVALETNPDGAQRVTLLRPLNELIGAG